MLPQRIGPLQGIGPHTRKRIGRGLLRSPAPGILIDRKEEHRVGTHEERIALRKVVAHHRGAPREEYIARLLPILAVIAEGKHLVLRIVDLDVPPQHHVVFGSEIVDAVAPHLLFLGQHITVARDPVKRIGLVVRAPVGIEVVAVLVPDVGILEEKSVVGGHVVDHRVALEFVFVVTHLDAVYANEVFGVGIIVAAHRFEPVVPVYQYAAVGELADILLRVENKPVGIERGIAVDDLDDVGIDPRLVQLAVVFGTVAVNIGRILVDEDIAEELDPHVRITHGTVARNDSAVMLRGEIAD